MKLYLISIFFIAPFLVMSQSYESKVNDYLTKELTKLNVPNVEIAIVDNNGVVFSNHYGKKPEAKKLFYLGSVSKSLTAFGILRLIKSNQLAFDEKVIAILPNLQFSDYGEDITVRHLLNHTSGIKKKTGFSALPTLAEMQENAYRIPINSPPGKRHEYSNMNYALLGLVIEKVSGLPYGKYMESEVFDPLEMNWTNVITHRSEEQNVVDQHQYWGPFPIKSKQVNFATTAVPAGFILSNSADMGKYLQVNLNQGMANNMAVLDSSLMLEMHRTWDNGEYGYAMGWKKGRYNNRTIYQHLGSTGTSYSAIFILPEQNLGFVLLTNSNSLSFSEGIAEGILSILTDGEAKQASSNEFYMRWGIMIAIILLVMRFFYLLKKAMAASISWSNKTKMQKIGVPLAIMISVILVFPFVAAISFWSFAKIQPDLGTVAVLLMLGPLLANGIAIIARVGR